MAAHVALGLGRSGGAAVIDSTMIFMFHSAMICSRCDNEHERKSSYCLACHAAYMREWRKTHPLTEAQKVKQISRSYAAVYKQRGHLVPQPCEVCGSDKVEMHHDDYSRPIDVRWRCREHHMELHR